MFGHLSHDKLESIIPNINKPIQQVIVDQGTELYNNTMSPDMRVELRTVPKNTPEMMLCKRTGQTIGDITRCLILGCSALAHDPRDKKP
eukprot:Pgem_evm1s8071